MERISWSSVGRRFHAWGGGNRKRPLAEFQTGPGNDVVAVLRVAKSRSWWDLSDCSQHASQVGWRLTNSHFVHKEAQFIVDPLLDRQRVQLLEC